MPDGVGAKHRDCAAIVLAAGSSSRLGQPKQLLLIDGESLLRRTARLAVEAGCRPVIVVLGFEHARMQSEVEDLAASVAVNETWMEGMGGSLRCGMQAVMQSAGCPENVLVLVCDQPGLNRTYLDKLLDTHETRNQSANMTASGYGGRTGVPAVFPREHYVELLESKGDEGARQLLRRLIQIVQPVEFSKGEIDIDLPVDLNTLR
jgi:molybdenum cofactor cytidylyltransferase